MSAPAYSTPLASMDATLQQSRGRTSADDFHDEQISKASRRVLHDEDLAQAIIDRLLERGRLLRLDGPSVRTLDVNLDEAMKEDSDQQADLARNFRKKVARISGIHN